MGKSQKNFFIWEIVGIFWIILVGSLLHFIYDWSGQVKFIGIFAPVNESLWEHLKMGYWALIIFSLIEYKYVRNKVKGFLLGKALGILSLEGVILIVFYTYTAMAGREILWIDIVSFIVGAVICQIVSYNIGKMEISDTGNFIGLMILILFGMMLIAFTFYPPRFPIFRDNNTGQYGIGFKR